MERETMYMYVLLYGMLWLSSQNLKVKIIKVGLFNDAMSINTLPPPPPPPVNTRND